MSSRPNSNKSFFESLVPNIVPEKQVYRISDSLVKKYSDYRPTYNTLLNVMREIFGGQYLLYSKSDFYSKIKNKNFRNNILRKKNVRLTMINRFLLCSVFFINNRFNQIYNDLQFHLNFYDIQKGILAFFNKNEQTFYIMFVNRDIDFGGNKLSIDRLLEVNIQSDHFEDTEEDDQIIEDTNENTNEDNSQNNYDADDEIEQEVVTGGYDREKFLQFLKKITILIMWFNYLLGIFLIFKTFVITNPF